MTETDTSTCPSQDVALIVGGGPGISSSCARLFAKEGMRVAVAARNPDKPVLQALEKSPWRAALCVRRQPTPLPWSFCSRTSPAILAPRRSSCTTSMAGFPASSASRIADAEPGMAFDTMRNSAFSAFLVGQQAARRMRENKPNANGAKGTIIFTNASAALKGFPLSGAFAMACHAKAGLAQSMARELMPQGIHVANVPIDAAIGWTQEDGTRAHRLAGTSVDDNLADPDHIAQTYLQLHRQHRSTWAFEIVLRPWVEKW